MTKMPFDFLPLTPARSAGKPRSRGLTMMIDMGLAPGFAADHLRVAGPYVDVAKIFVGSARLYDEAVFREKAATYGEHGIGVFIGGQFLEYVVHAHGMEHAARFMDEAARLGVDAVEVSDNCVPLSDADRGRLIRAGLDAGLEVHGEVGSKDEQGDPDDLVRQAVACLEEGCDMVLVEAAELVGEEAGSEILIERLRSGVDADKMMIELPGPWIKGVTLNDVFEMKKRLIRTFGPEANIGNVMPDQVINLEALRCDIGIAGPGSAQASG